MLACDALAVAEAAVRGRCGHTGVRIKPAVERQLKATSSYIDGSVAVLSLAGTLV
jgi:hypothetical protein